MGLLYNGSWKKKNKKERWREDQGTRKDKRAKRKKYVNEDTKVKKDKKIIGWTVTCNFIVTDIFDKVCTLVIILRRVVPKQK